MRRMDWTGIPKMVLQAHVSTELHEAVKAIADDRGISANTYINYLLALGVFEDGENLPAEVRRRCQEILGRVKDAYWRNPKYEQIAEDILGEQL